MILAALILLPAGAGAAAFCIQLDALRRALLIGTAAVHTALVVAVWQVRPGPVFGGWLAIDAQGLIFLTITSALFLAAAAYGLQALSREPRGSRPDFEEDVLIANAPEATFTGCLLFFLATMTLVTLSQHFGLLWVAIEASTLVSAPLIYFHRHHRSLEATWKYLMICSVGVALALLGNFFLAFAGAGTGLGGSMLLADLVEHANAFQPDWLKAAFIFLLVGYGAKMGLAPLHTWLPDAHSEAPSLVSALLSGSLLNCAFLGILRVAQVALSGGEHVFVQRQLVLFGLLSMGLAAVFIFSQPDYKRLLAYSSVEHVGILALGVGLAGEGPSGAMLHAINHSFTKAMLFMVAGNILAVYRTKSCDAVRGMGRVLPGSAFLWLAGFFAITGTPPFGTFLSEFTILRAALGAGAYATAVTYLIFLALVFVGMSRAVLAMVQGPAPGSPSMSAPREHWLSIAPPAALALAVLVLGIYVPPVLQATLMEAARAVGGP